MISGIALTYGILCQQAAAVRKTFFTVAGLGFLNATRKRGRSLGIVIVLACASFLIFAVGANLRNPLENIDQPESGTGGFSWLAESTLPVLYDLNSKTGQQALGLDESVMSTVLVVPFRMREGGDASCLNLNRVKTPQLLGVSTETFQKRKSFTFVQSIDDRKENFWPLLDEKLAGGRIPAVADQATILWGLK